MNTLRLTNFVLHILLPKFLFPLGKKKRLPFNVKLWFEFLEISNYEWKKHIPEFSEKTTILKGILQFSEIFYQVFPVPVLFCNTQIGEADQKALEIISIVGCSISLLAVVITIAVTLFFWRVLKSPRSKVLLNLCAAVAVSCILVISEGSARDNKV